MKDNIAVVGRGLFLGIVHIRHDRHAIDHRWLFPERVLIVLVNIPLLNDSPSYFLSAALDDGPDRDLGFPDIGERRGHLDPVRCGLFDQPLAQAVIEDTSDIADTSLIVFERRWNTSAMNYRISGYL